MASAFCACCHLFGFPQSLLLNYRHAELQVQERRQKLKLVVVINSFRRPLTLAERSLRSVLQQKIPPQKLIFIDQNPSPLELPEDLRKHPLLEIQKSSATSVSSARNGVVLPENCEWVCFCDDDGYWETEFSERLQALLQENNFDVIAGSVIREDTLDFYSLRHKLGGNLQEFRNQKLLMGSNFCVRREIFENVNRFDPRFGAGSRWGSSEETDFAWKCFFAGARMTFQPELKVIHVAPFNESLKQGFKKSYRYAVGKGALVGKWLLEEKKGQAFHELAEMVTVPLIQILRGILTFRWSLAINNCGVLWGRIRGLVKFALDKHRSQK